jgi:hypothetical protein
MCNQTKSNYANIIGFNRDTHIAQLSNITGLNWENTDVLVIRQTLPKTIGAITSATLTTINFPFNLDKTYINNFVRVYADVNTVDYQIVKIVNIVPTIIDDIVVATNTATITPSFSSIPSPGWRYEILGFDIDNVSPFVYNGTMSASSQPVAYEMTLNSLTLPNVTLNSGGRIAYYPYIYIEIDNVSSTSSITKNTIYSNNPHTYKAVFKVPITDLNHPQQSPFVKLTGNGMKQTVVFKQNDDMRIAVKLPNGEVFKTSTSDTSFGNLPNPFLQISAVFGIEKI